MSGKILEQMEVGDCLLTAIEVEIAGMTLYINGYITLPKNSNLDGVDYDEIDIEIHGGLTYSGRPSMIDSERWTIGFDTAHFGDNTDEIQNVDYIMDQLKQGLIQLKGKL